MSSSRFTAATGMVTLLMMVAFLLSSGRISDLRFSPQGAGWSATIAIVCTVLPFYLLYESIKRVGASRVSLVSTCGPAFLPGCCWTKP